MAKKSESKTEVEKEPKKAAKKEAKEPKQAAKKEGAEKAKKAPKEEAEKTEAPAKVKAEKKEAAKAPKKEKVKKEALAGSKEELEAQHEELSKKIFILKNELNINRKLEQPHLLRETKKERARILTALRQIELAKK